MLPSKKNSFIANNKDIKLLFIEEPEAHTHPQLQYIFARKVSEIVSGIPGMQTVITTHSPHIVASHPFENIRYMSTIVYITMHKTKGTSISSVIVVMEEYFWNEYDFSLLYRPDETKTERQENSQKLIYVACSRARNNLVCVRVITKNEVEPFKRLFPQAEEITLPSNLVV